MLFNVVNITTNPNNESELLLELYHESVHPFTLEVTQFEIAMTAPKSDGTVDATIGGTVEILLEEAKEIIKNAPLIEE